jgi:homocysteine S-methyltransferase
MTSSTFRVIDGGLATELARRGMDISDELWSARVLIEAPDAIEQVHTEYYLAGADIALTASYQASYDGYARRGLDTASTTAALRRSVELARSARSRALQARPAPERDLLVAASVGPYGAVLHDGSEYRGDYGLDVNALVDFHRRRFTVLADAGADLLACETIPSRIEATALTRLLAERPDARAWITFTCRDGRHTSAGDPIAECARELGEAPQVVAIGVNCVAPELVESLIGELLKGTTKPIVVYPNSGETWDAAARNWVGTAARFTHHVPRWLGAGASWIGGCCRTTPEDIRRVRADVDAFAAARATVAARPVVESTPNSG